MNALLHYLSEKPRIITVLIVLMTLITLALTLLPSEMMASGKLWAYDKIGHFLLFGIWTYLFGLHWHFIREEEIRLFTVFLIGASFGITIELLQQALPLNRSADLFDVAFDSLGCFLAVILLYKTPFPHE